MADDIEIKRIESDSDPLYVWMVKLLTEAFPEEERRDIDQLHRLIDTEKRFNCCVAIRDTEPVGLINFWDFDDFLYIEHLATAAEMRNRRIGEKMLEFLLNTKRTIVLEVERPVDELTRRRIKFYQRNGFVLLPYDYVQPPYRKGGTELPMKIMSATAAGSCTPDFETIRDTLRREVYGLMP